MNIDLTLFGFYMLLLLYIMWVRVSLLMSHKLITKVIC
jgi:hypothetical protein